MKKTLYSFTLSTLILAISSSSQASPSNSSSTGATAEHNAWLMEKYSEQHNALIPVVAVADMFYACNKERNVDSAKYQLAELITKVDRNQLAEKLALCLGDDDMQSDVALNFGLLGCFHEQLAHLPAVERQQKMALVEKAILSLSRSERKKSFTQCVTEQAIHYLQ